ncbi:hypothetical protein D3C75_915070 [compost metagenome]
MIQRMYHRVVSKHSAQQLNRPVSQYFIYIHIGRSARSALQRINGELLHVFPGLNIITSLHNGPGNLRRIRIQLQVSQRRRFFHRDQAQDQIRVNHPPAYREILHSPGRMNSIIC